MSKKYWDGPYNINTDWGGDDSTENLPLPGSAVQKLIKNEINSKVGYMIEDKTTGEVKFYTSEQSYLEDKKPIGSVTSVQRYSMSLKFDEKNQYVFFSNTEKKEIIWYFKTIEVASNQSYAESVSVSYTINTGGKVITRNMVIDSDSKIEDNGFTKVVLNLDEYVGDGVSTIDIEVTGLKTKQRGPLQTKVTIITFEMEDKTIFNKPFENMFYITTNVKCTTGQIYNIEYKLNDSEEWIKTEGNYVGNGQYQTQNVNIDIENLDYNRHVIEYRVFINLGADGIYCSNIQRIEFIKGINTKFNEPQLLIFSNYSEGDTIKNKDGNLIINGILQYVPYTIKYSIFNSDKTEGSTTLSFYEVLNDSEKEIMTTIVNNEETLEYTIQYTDYEVKCIKIVAKNSDGVILNGEGRLIYLNIEKSNFAINLFKTNLRFSISSVGKNKNDRIWVSNVGKGIPSYNASFSDDFDWSQGWTEDGLVVSNGKVVFDYAPFPIQKSNPSAEEKIEYVGGENAFSIEMEFKTQNVTNEDAVVCDMLTEISSTYMGLQITGTEFKFILGENTFVSSRFKSGEMNRFALVFRPRYSEDKTTFKGLVELYNNGILSNIAKYDETTKFEVYEYVNKIGQSKRLSFKGGKGADIVVKYVNTYNGVMAPDNVVDNYIIYRSNTSEMLNLYNKNNVINENGDITPESVIKLGNIPVLIFIGRTNSNIATGNNDDVIGEDGKPIYTPSSTDEKDSYHYETLEQTTNKKDSVEMDVIYYNPLDKTKNFKFVKAYITPQGTSSMYYPKKNYRIYTQKTNTRMFLSIDENNPLEYVDMIKPKFGEEENDRKYEVFRGLDKKSVKKRLYSFKDNAQPVKCWCLKADFAETSSSHNTGIARLWNDTLKKSTAETVKDKNVNVFKTNAQELTEIKYNFNINGDMPDVRTTIDGFPIVVFGAKSYDENIKFLGQYNFNNDKSTESVFGFCDIDDSTTFSSKTWNYDTNIQTENIEYTLDGMLNKYMTCVETLDNGNVLANFTEIDYIDNDGVEKKWDDIWDDAFEFRYPEIPEEPDAKDFEGGKESQEYQSALTEYNKELKDWKNKHLKPFKHFCTWVHSTKWCDVNGNVLTGITTEEAKIRKEKFAKEKWEHLDVWKVAAYYIYVMRFGAVDQVVKNSMLTSEGPFAYDNKGDKYGYWDLTDETSSNYGKQYKWYYINYDNDTIMGVKNDGSLVYGPEITRKSVEGSNNNPVYAGSTSVLWNNLDADEEFQQIVRIADQGISQMMPYKTAINMFDVEQVGKWCERMYNKDAEYKYISPYISDWVYTGDDENADVFSDKLFMLQGSRTAHRRWWLSKRFNLFDGKWGSGDFPKKYVEVKCDYATTGDKFNAVAGANAYFGYQINNKTFGSPEGGETSEYKVGETINWVLKKNVQIGDPIALYGAIDMSELNLMGLSKNLREVNFQFGVETDNENKLEHLIVSIPDELLLVKSYYDTYADSKDKSAFENLILDYPSENLKVEDFEVNGKYYNPNNIQYDANDKNAPKFYRVEVVEIEEDKKYYVYFAKKDNGVRNSSCNGINFSKLKNLQTLKMAGYIGISKLDLTSNIFINTLDIRYSKISSVAFSQGSRIKDFKASDALTSLNFNSCGNIKLQDIKINDESLKINGGVNINTIEIFDSVGLNHDNSFKDFILNWIKYGNISEKRLTLTNIKWKDVTIKDLKDIMSFNEQVFQCLITGEISMSNNNISQEDYAYLDKFKKLFNNIKIRIPYPNILAKPMNDIVAGETVEIEYYLLADDESINTEGSIQFKFVKEVSSEYQSDADVIFDSIKGKYYKFIEDSEIRNGNVKLNINKGILETDEVIINENTKILIALLFTFEGSTKFDISSFTINDPTYAKTGFISGENSMHEKGGLYEYNLILNTQDGKTPIGTIIKTWTMESVMNEDLTENAFDFIESSAITNNDNTLVIKLKDDCTPDKIANLNVKVEINNYNSNFNDFIIEKQLSILNEHIVVTDSSNKIVMDILYKNKFSESPYYITDEEVGKITDISTLFKGITKDSDGKNVEWSFDEFIYFTGVTSLSDSAFEESTLTSIRMPNSVNTIGKSIFKDCRVLESVVLSENINIITDYMFYNCKKIINVNIPNNVEYINSNSFGGANIEKILFTEQVSDTTKVIFINEESNLYSIYNNAFESTTFNIENTNISTNILSEISLPQKLSFSENTYNYLLSPALSIINISKLNEKILLEDCVLYASNNKEIIVRALPINENEKVENLDLNVTRVYNYAFYNCNTIKNVKFSSSLNPFGLGVGAFYSSNIENIDLSNCNNLKIIENYTFYNTPKLKSVLLPENGKLNTLGYQLFYNSQELSAITIPNTVYYVKNGKFKGIGNNTGYSYLFENCGIESLRLPDNLQLKYYYYIKDCKKLKEFYFPKNHIFGVDDKYEIVTGCESLETVHLPIFSRIVEDDNAYFACENGRIVSGPFIDKNEAEVYVSDTNLSVETRLSGTIITNENFYVKARFNSFENCKNLKTYVIHEEDKCNIMVATNSGVDDNEDEEIVTGKTGASIIRVGRYDNEINEIVELTTPSLVKLSNGSVKYITPNKIKELESGAFSHCSITYIKLFDDLEQINDALFAKSKLEEIELPSTITKINSEAFAGSNIRILTLPENVISLGDNVFLECSKLEEVILNNKLESIGRSCFESSTLRKINLNENLNLLGDSTFERCKNLVEVTIPKNINIIPQNLFLYCENLEKVVIKSKELLQIESFAFNSCRKLNEIILLSKNAPILETGNKYYISNETDNSYNYNCYEYHPFGYDRYTIVGKAVKDDKKKIFLPRNNKGYDVEKWEKPLFTAYTDKIEKINYPFRIYDLEFNLTEITFNYNSFDVLWVKIGEDNDVIEAIYKNGLYNVAFGNIKKYYHGDIVYVYSDESCDVSLGSFELCYDEKHYELSNEIILGNTSASLFNSNLFNCDDASLNNEEDYIKITKQEYNAINAKINYLLKLIK